MTARKPTTRRPRPSEQAMADTAGGRNPIDSIDNIGTTPDGRVTMTVTGDEAAIRDAAEAVGMDVEPADPPLTAAAMADGVDGIAADIAAQAIDDLPEGATVTMLGVKGPKAPGEPGRVLVTMHYPLRMDVVSGIMRLVSKWYPNSVVGEDGVIREASK